MKKTIKQYIIPIVIFLALLLLMLCGCKTNTVYVPVEKVKIEYQDRISRDSIHLYDSVFVKMANDTVWLEKYKYLYRDKLVRDSVYVTDSIQVPYPVKEYIEVNRLTSFQSFQIWVGRITFLTGLLYLIFYILRRRLRKV